MASGVDAVDGAAVEHAAGFQFHGDHLARPQAALGDDLVLGDAEGAGFGGDHQRVVGARPARRPKPVAVEQAAGIAAVVERDRGRAVPRLGMQRVVLVEGGEVGVERGERVRRGWDQDAQRGQRVEAAGQHHLEHVVEALRVRAVLAHQRAQRGEVEAFGLPQRAARPRPAAVAGNGVDLAVVRQVAEGLRQRPARRGVGGEALVHNDAGAGHRRVHQVREQQRQPLGDHHRLEAEGIRRERDDVAGVVVAQCERGAAAGQEQRAAEFGVGQRGGRRDEELFDVRTTGIGDGSAGVEVQRYAPPAGDDQAALACGVGDLLPRRLCLRDVARQEHEARGELRRQSHADVGGASGQPRGGALQQHAGTVAGGAIGGDRAAMRHALQRVEGEIDMAAFRHPVERRDQAEAAGVVFERRVVEPARRFASLVRLRC